MDDFVVIPAHNEERKLADILAGVQKHNVEIVVVDDGSTDQTSVIAKQEGVMVLKHRVNLGKGAALKTGCDYAIREGAKRIVVIDADGQHDPKDIPRFLSSLEDKDIVFSYRKRSKKMPFVLKFGNTVINTTLRSLYGMKIRDSQCGFRSFRADTYRKVRWQARDYFMETEMIVNTGKRKLRYRQIPIETVYGDKFKGTTVKDGVTIVMKMIGGRLVR
jgi:glycosyltransferase involved in cell wall biosynthesis